MKSFKAFRLDTENHILWRNGDRVPATPKSYDVLAYLVKHAGRVVTQGEILGAVWPETYVNPEVLRKYILEVRKVLGDRPENPQFIETLPKRGYRFVAPVIDIDDESPESPELSTSPEIEEEVKQDNLSPEASRSTQESSSDKHRLWKVAIVPVLVLVVVTGIGEYLRLARDGANSRSLNKSSIAVLPFADISPAAGQEYFSDGLAEQLIHDLAKVSGLKVVGRSSAFQFKGKNEDLREVGRKLGVANVLEGSVRREGNHVRITAELIQANDGFQLWSQTYDRQIDDIFAVQDEIAQATTEALQVKLLGGNGQPVASNSRSANPDAYQAYLEAKYFLGRGQSKEDLGKALDYVDTAIKLDNTYAPAWALRASVQNVMAEVGLSQVTEGFREARDDAERAIALDPASALAYLALATTQIDYDWDWDAANTCLTKAAALEPGNSEVFRTRSFLSRVRGNLDQAIQLYEQAIALDPLRANYHLGLGYVLYLAGRYDQGQTALKKALDLNPQATRAHSSIGKILIAEGKPRQALVEIEKEPSEGDRLIGETLVYHALGREQDSTASLARLIAKHQNDSAYQIAQAYAFRGESDKSFEWLERAYRQRDAGLTELKTDPLLKTVSHDPRYSELLKKLRLLK